MALPPQAIEKLIREPQHTQGAYRDLLLVSGAIFALTLIIYLGLAFGYQTYLNSSLAGLTQQVKQFSTGISQEDSTQIEGFYSQLVNVRTLLTNHTVASPVLSLLEATAQPNVYYTKLTLNTSQNQVTVTGAAQTLDAAAAQAAAIESQPQVDHLNFNNAGAQTSGPWQFTMTIYLKAGVLSGGAANAGAAASTSFATTTAATTTSAAAPSASASTTTSAR